MDCTEAYREHIMYSFNGFCKVVIRYAAINAWRDRNRRRQKEISFEYLTEEKFYPLRHYSKRIRFAALENGYVNADTEDSIKQQLITALFQFRFD